MTFHSFPSNFYNLHILVSIIFIPVSPFASTNDRYTHDVSLISRFSKQYMHCALLHLELIFERFLGYLEMTFNESKYLVTIGVLKSKNMLLKVRLIVPLRYKWLDGLQCFYSTITMRQTRDWIELVRKRNSCCIHCHHLRCLRLAGIWP